MRANLTAWNTATWDSIGRCNIIGRWCHTHDSRYEGGCVVWCTYAADVFDVVLAALAAHEKELLG